MSRPLRFLHVTTFYPPYSFGGDGLYVYRLAHAIADRGHHVDVVHCIDSYRLFNHREPDAPFADHPNVTVHGLKSSFGWLSPLLSHQTGRPLLQSAALSRILDQPYDVIHFHNISLFGPKVLTFANGRDRTVTLYTTHEHWLVCPMHVLWKFNHRPCDRPTCFSCTVAAGRPPQLWRYTSLMTRATASVDLFLAPSRFTAGMHAERGFDRKFTHLAPFAIRCDDDWRDPGRRPHDRPYFLFVGRLEPVKGLDTVIREWDQVSDIDLLIVGDGSERTRVEAARVRNRRIVLCGAVAPGSLGPYFVHSIATLVPSVTYEVAPTVVLEAFARKTPVIARDLGGTSEFVRESGGGLLFRTGSELLDAIGRLASDPQLRHDLGESGYQTFIRRWTADVHLDAYFGIIDEIARVKFGRPPWKSGATDIEPQSLCEPSLNSR